MAENKTTSITILRRIYAVATTIDAQMKIQREKEGRGKTKFYVLEMEKTLSPTLII
jgi:hypothetical protein